MAHLIEANTENYTTRRDVTLGRPGGSGSSRLRASLLGDIMHIIGATDTALAVPQVARATKQSKPT